MSSDSAPYFSWEGFREGARLSLPLMPGLVVFAMTVGAIASQKGLTLLETALMSALVYAGASQLVALEAWSTPVSAGAVVTLALIAATVNLRYVLMGASLRPWFGVLPTARAYGTLAMLVDANWLIGSRYRQQGGADIGVFVGSGAILWANWVIATIPGHLLGGLITDPRRFGLDFVLPAFFAALLVPMWRGTRRGACWLFAGVVAVVVAKTVPGYWFIIVGALAGSIAAGFVDGD
jgi:4-azaleucine resistance transporter AzlC